MEVHLVSRVFAMRSTRYTIPRTFSLSLSSAARSVGAVALAKARVDAQRARVALTHASGKYVPPPSRPQRTGQDQHFKNPYIKSSLLKQTSLPRLPGPAPGSRIAISPQKRHIGSSPPSSPIPGAYPTAQAAQIRTALPAHLAKASSTPTQPPESRLRLPDRQLTLKEIRKPTIEKFTPPKPAREVFDFFGGRAESAPKGLMASLGRSQEAERGEKRKVPDKDATDQTSMLKVTPATLPPMSLPSTPAFPPSTHTRPVAADESAKLDSILFRRKKPRHGIGRVGA